MTVWLSGFELYLRHPSIARSIHHTAGVSALPFYICRRTELGAEPMTHRTITATITDRREPDNTEWVFISELRGADWQDHHHAAETVKPVAGLLTVQLEPDP